MRLRFNEVRGFTTYLLPQYRVGSNRGFRLLLDGTEVDRFDSSDLSVMRRELLTDGVRARGYSPRLVLLTWLSRQQEREWAGTNSLLQA